MTTPASPLARYLAYTRARYTRARYTRARDTRGRATAQLNHTTSGDTTGLVPFELMQ